MPILSKMATHDYDSKIVNHNYSSNISHLNSWIDELISLTEGRLHGQKETTTDTLVHSMRGYSSIFHELLRQVAIFSEPITKNLNKVWDSVQKLLNFMIKCHHRFSKQSQHMMEQVQNLLMDKQRSEAANKIQKDEFDL